jgi:glycosyltransferase involved in cell wall biosynthesis
MFFMALSFEGISNRVFANPTGEGIPIMENPGHSNNLPLFSVIVLHYNQQKFLHIALDSVFMQNYPNLELIIADDGTARLDTEEIIEYIASHKTPEVKNVIYQFNKQNLGTVRNVNSAIMSCNGKYVIFFAADDCLYDNNVIRHFVDNFEKLGENEYVLSAQCIMMDELLEKKEGTFVNVPLALSLNSATARQQYEKIVFSCMYASGATAFKKEFFEKYSYFDTTYKIIEDWTYFLSLTRNGYKIFFADFNALLHRDGGVSHFNQVEPAPHVIEYKNDSLLAQEKEIFPLLKSFTTEQQSRIIARYEYERQALYAICQNKKRLYSRWRIALSCKSLFLHKVINWLMARIAIYRKKLMKLFLYVMIGLIGLYAAFSVFGILGYPPFQGYIFGVSIYSILSTAMLIIICSALVILFGFGAFYMLLHLRRKLKFLFSKYR